uniref:CTB family bacteriocin n=1 Tax=Scytonema sp. PCC 10023 TaxID=1680591 RepID=UPI0039C750FF
MSDALFIELSVEQQEVVAGGFGLYSIPTVTEDNYANYNLNSKAVMFATTAVAGPGGASSTKVFKAS